MVVDDAYRHVFIAGGQEDNEVLVLNYKGKVISKLIDLPFAQGLTIDSKHHTLYVTECWGHAIQAFDTATLARGKRFRVGTKHCPGGPVVIGGTVWFAAQPGIGHLDPTSGRVRIQTGIDFNVGWLASDPLDPTVLMGAKGSSSPTEIYRYSIDSDAVLKIEADSYATGGTYQIGVTNDGQHLITASDGGYGLQSFRLADLSPDSTYDTGDTSNRALVISRHSPFIVGGIGPSSERDDIVLFRQDESAPVNTLGTYQFGDAVLQERGLGLTSDDSTLFAVASQPGTAPINFYVFKQPRKVRSSLTLTANPSSLKKGDTTTLSGTLTYEYGTEVGGQVIHLTRRNPDGSKTQLLDAVTDASGAYASSDAPPAEGSFTYVARYDGDKQHLGADGTAKVSVSSADQIVFDSDATGDYEIYVVDGDGSGLTQLTNNPADDYDPVWSPDMSQIAFSSSRNGNYEVWTMNADGSNLKRITSDSHYDGNPSWAPNGQTLAFESDRAGSMDIWTVDLNGGALHRRTASSAVDEFPSWSPDGTRIAFDTDRTGNFEVFTMNADGSNVTNVTNSSHSDGGASWSPDGAKLAFGSDRTGDFQVWTLTLSNGALKQLTNVAGFDGEQSYSPDGARIAFASERSGTKQIWVMKADGSNPVQYTDAGSYSELPDWRGVP
jgi:Tol biopolymer transport system component